MEIKKNKNVDLEARRREMFLVALAIILSCLYGAFNWQFQMSDDIDAEMLDDVIENLDFEKLKKDNDMVAAVSETEEFVETSNIKPSETMPAPDTQQSTVLADLAEAMERAKLEDSSEAEKLITPSALNSEEGLRAIEELPEFPGGAGAFMKWITANLKYPRAAKQRKLKGKVVVSFLVTEEGGVEELKVDKTSSAYLADEVMRVMKTMPRWKPGKQNGVPCTTMVAVPINFEL